VSTSLENQPPKNPMPKRRPKYFDKKEEKNLDL
jgi:hypothetical protein